ncbi:MAG: universal stress protein, partial [Acidobacteriota bacterium]
FDVPDTPAIRLRIVVAETKLAAIAAGFTLAGATVTIEVRSGSPAREIIAVAAQRRTDLILIGAHGRTCSSHAVYGSVAERVVRTAPCPVLTACEPAFDFVPVMAGMSTDCAMS